MTDFRLLGNVLECGWCGKVVIVGAGDVRVDYYTGQPHVHLRLVKGETA